MPLAPLALSYATRARDRDRDPPGRADRGGLLHRPRCRGCDRRDRRDRLTACTLYQGVTLGGTGFARGKRHPTLERLRHGRLRREAARPDHRRPGGEGRRQHRRRRGRARELDRCRQSRPPGPRRGPQARGPRHRLDPPPRPDRRRDQGPLRASRASSRNGSLTTAARRPRARRSASCGRSRAPPRPAAEGNAPNVREARRYAGVRDVHRVRLVCAAGRSMLGGWPRPSMNRAISARRLRPARRRSSGCSRT